MLGLAKLFRRHFERMIVARTEFTDAIRIDVESYSSPMLSELYRQRESDIAETDDGQLQIRRFREGVARLRGSGRCRIWVHEWPGNFSL
jgi:hypothetical protein